MNCYICNKDKPVTDDIGDGWRIISVGKDNPYKLSYHKDDNVVYQMVQRYYLCEECSKLLEWFFNNEQQKHRDADGVSYSKDDTPIIDNYYRAKILSDNEVSIGNYHYILKEE